MRVLVIEDDDSVRAAVRRALLLGGYEVLLAENGEQGLLHAQSDVPDAIILDLGLPDIDGMQVARTLRSSGNRTPILMLTARDLVSDRVTGLDAGADDYLAKPFALEALRARVRALLRRSANGVRDVIKRLHLKRCIARAGILGKDRYSMVLLRTFCANTHNFQR